MGHYLSEMLDPEPYEGSKYKTFTIKPNDEITLKDKFEDYVRRIKGGLIDKYGLRYKRRESCKDPEYVLDYQDMLLFRSKTVVVELTDTKTRFDNEGKLIGNFYYITVRDRSGNRQEFPIEFINKSHCLRRDHKRILLLNKKLIC